MFGDSRILIVDDNEEITEVISFYCNSKKDIGCQVINDVQQGLERIREENFDLILLDIAMPEFSGWDIIQSLKQGRLIESKNLVIFTASSDRKIMEVIQNIGVKEILKKPCSLDALTELIEKYRPSR